MSKGKTEAQEVISTISAESVLIRGESNWIQMKTVIWLIWFVCLVCLVCLVFGLNETNQMNQINQINKTNQINESTSYCIIKNGLDTSY